MASLSVSKRRKTFISREKGQSLPIFDLSGETDRHDHLKKSLEDSSEDLALRLSQEMRLLLDYSALKIACSEWSEELVSKDLVWAEAESESFQGYKPLFAMSKKAVFSVSELFFAGSPNDISEKSIAKRDITDTDKRLISRLFNAAISILSESIGVEPASWNNDWAENPDTESCFWSTLTVNGENWEMDFLIGWPTSLSKKKDSKEAIEFTRNQIEAQLEKTPVHLSSEIASVSLNLSDINDMKEGDIIEFDMHPEIMASAGGVVCVSGKIFESDGHLGLRIDQNMGMNQ
jgi:flagellar motor switch protein FliM